MASYDQVIKVPDTLTAEKICSWSTRIGFDTPKRATLFEASDLQHVPPFGMLFLSACIRRYRRRVFGVFPIGVQSSMLEADAQRDQRAYLAAARNPLLGGGSVDVKPNLQNGYAGHMGLWQSLGVSEGKAVGEAAGSAHYLPITRIVIDDLLSDASKRRAEIGDVIYDRADDLAEVVARSSDGAMHSTLAYSIRELMRNVAEHSNSQDMWYCAQFWPTKDLVEFAILDEGRGIYSSLRENQSLAIPSEVQAIIKSTERGVSRVVPRLAAPSVWGNSEGSRWVNAGWGLFVMKQLALKARGSLLVVSNRNAVIFEPSGTHTLKVDFEGTAIRLLVKPSMLSTLLRDILRESTVDQPPSRLTPSMLDRINNSWI